MKVFMTGATGFIGSAVTRELAGAGHAVTALLRSPEKTDYLADELGGRPAYGDITVPASYRSLAREYDALVHLAFQIDGDTVAADRTAVDALLEAARTGERPRIVIYTSGCWVLGETGQDPADENAPIDHPADVVSWRPAHERRVLEAGGDGFATAVIRPGMVYGGHSSLVGSLFESAESRGAAEYVEDGQQHWSLVHRDDLARLYRMVVEEEASGVFHGVDGTPVRVGEAARAASEAAGAEGATREVPLAEARDRLGPVADALALDQRLVAPGSRALGWSPARASFLESVREAYEEWREATGRSAEDG